MVALELQNVFVYRKWSAVLKAFGLSLAKINYLRVMSEAKSTGATRESRAASFGGGGESPEHRTLKQFVANHPEIVGLPPAVAPGTTEEPLQSGDMLDVFFRNGQESVAVEVKSRRSGEIDIVRGMFQCVKYQVVLEAQQSVDGVLQNARAILVLEGKLPEKFQAMKNILGIEVVDQIDVALTVSRGR